MKSVKFYDKYTLFLGVFFIFLIFFEIFWIRQKILGNEIIPLTFNLIIVGIFLVAYIIYSFYITSLFIKIKSKHGSTVKQLILFNSPILSPLFYLVGLRKILKQDYSQNQNFYNN